MTFNFADFLIWQSLSILLDVLVVWYILYLLLMLIKETKAAQLAKGLVVIWVARQVTGWIGLNIFVCVVDQLLSWLVIGVIVISQPEIRRGLEHLGRMPFFNGNARTERQISEKFVAELDKAIQYMNKKRIGALITIQHNTGLSDYIETGISLDAEATGALSINIFIPNTPLHDDAIIIRNDRIAVAAAHLPLSDNSMIPKKLGTRHRAAVGISGVTDTVAIVISEETGGVTITKNSQFMSDTTRDEYTKHLASELVPKDEIRQTVIQKLLDRLWNWGAGR